MLKSIALLTSCILSLASANYSYYNSYYKEITYYDSYFGITTTYNYNYGKSSSKYSSNSYYYYYGSYDDA